MSERQTAYPRIGTSCAHCGEPILLDENSTEIGWYHLKLGNVECAVPAQPAPPSGSFQSRVQPWMMECFGPEISRDIVERNHRFLEESLELVQASGCTQSEAHQLVDYVYGRPSGLLAQEVGGVMVTLAALCLAYSCLDMHECGEEELARISAPETITKIRAKQAAKPEHSPLPAATTPMLPTPPTRADVFNECIQIVGRIDISDKFSDHWQNGFFQARADAVRDLLVARDGLTKLSLPTSETSAAEEWRIERTRQMESSAATPPLPTQAPPVPSTFVLNVAQRVPYFRKWMIAQLTAMGDKQDTGALKEFIAAPTWREIESAPRDGTRILAYPVFGYAAKVYWWVSRDGQHSNFIEDGGNGVQPTHWMPLPPAPSESDRPSPEGK